MTTLDEFRAMVPIERRFPLVFRSGARWDSFEGHCGACDRAFEPRELRGTVEQPFASVFVVDALGYCEACRLLTPFLYRFHEDMGMTGPPSAYGRLGPVGASTSLVVSAVAPGAPVQPGRPRIKRGVWAAGGCGR